MLAVALQSVSFKFADICYGVFQMHSRDAESMLRTF